MKTIILLILIFNKIFVPQDGDLVFQDIDCDSVCDAIEDVTKGLCNASISHIGMVITINDSLYVLEAINEGVGLTKYSEFLSRSLDSEGKAKVMVLRLKNKYTHLIPAAIKSALRYINKPYDYFFEFNNDSLYCAELIYFAFKEANNNEEFFEAAPMTFKCLKTGLINEYWVNYFKNFGKEIPEGKVGINPASISRSDKLNLVYIYGSFRNENKDCLLEKMKNY